MTACYRPLRRLARPDALPASNASILGRLVRRQVREPAEEALIAARLTRLTPIRDDVSLAVQAQYEGYPYPRWLRMPSTEGAAPIALRLRLLFPHAGAAAAVRPRPSMLIAGCGTGRHAAVCAALDRDSRILVYRVAQ